MPKTKKKTVTNDRGERQVSCWLPDDFMDEFDDYVAKLNESSGVRRVTFREQVYKAIEELMKNHPA